MDCFVTDPHNNILYNERKKQYDSFSHTTTLKGIYKVCFSNEFSTFTHKIVYLDFRHGDEKPLMASMSSSTALTQVRLRNLLHLKNKVLTIRKDCGVVFELGIIFYTPAFSLISQFFNICRYVLMGKET